MDDITDFLYLIGSVFAPMIAIQIADVLLLRHDRSDAAFCLDNLLIWLAGFILYRLLMRTDFVLGNTLPEMVIVMLITLFVHKLRQAMTKRKHIALPDLSGGQMSAFFICFLLFQHDIHIDTIKPESLQTQIW